MKTEHDMNLTHTLAALAIVLAAGAPLAAAAADDHGHDHGAPATSAGVSLPRFAAVSEAFELVGIVDGRKLTVYLDRFDDNAPVKDARIELELGGAKVAVKQESDGEYRAVLSRELMPGNLAVTATIVAGSETDILAADFHVDDRGPADNASPIGWRWYAAWGAGVALALALLMGVGYRMMVARRARKGGAS